MPFFYTAPYGDQTRILYRQRCICITDVKIKCRFCGRSDLPLFYDLDLKWWYCEESHEPDQKQRES